MLDKYEKDGLRTASREKYGEFLDTGNADSLDEAVSTGEQLVVGGDAVEPSDLLNLAIGRLARWDLAHQSDDLDRAMAVLQLLESASPPSGDQRDPQLLATVARATTAEAIREQSVPGLTRAIARYHEALAFSGNSTGQAIMCGLAEALHARGILLSSERDLNDAMTLLMQADPDPIDARDRVRVYQQVVAMMTDHNRVTGEELDCAGIASELKTAIDALPPGSPERADALTDLGVLLQFRFRQDGQPATLEAAVDAFRAAIDDPAGSVTGRPVRLHNLATAYVMAHQEGHLPSRLPEAQRLVDRAIALTDEADGNARSAYLYTLGEIHLARSSSGSRDAHQREEAAAQFRAASRTGSSTPTTLDAAVRWGWIHLERTEWASALEAFDVALDRASHLFTSLDTTDSKLRWLAERGRWPGAAAVAASYADAPTRGVEFLEQARALLLGEHVMRRDAQLVQVRAFGFATLADRFEKARRRKDEDAVDQAADEIRRQPGCQGFLRSTTFNDVVRIAKGVPVVYLVSSPFGGLALVVRAGQASVVDVPGLLINDSPDGLKALVVRYLDAYDEARTRSSVPAVRRWASALDQLTGWAGPAVMERVVAALQGESRAHLVPVGPLALVPWHAAWSDDPTLRPERQYAMDQVTFTYTPTIAALTDCVPPEPGGSAFAACNPQPVTLPTLTAAPLEVDGMRVALPDLLRLDGRDCTKDEVLSGIRRADIAHLACHAAADPWAPTAGHLVVSDNQQITVAELATEQVDAGLVVLSACETNAGGRILADEALTLSYALLEASANATIGSLWLASDVATAVIMTRFYELWVDQRIPAHEALRRAQQWFRDTALGDIARYVVARLPTGAAAVPDIEALDQQNLVHSHPVFWAPFVYSGA